MWRFMNFASICNTFRLLSFRISSLFTLSKHEPRILSDHKLACDFWQECICGWTARTWDGTLYPENLSPYSRGKGRKKRSTFKGYTEENNNSTVYRER